MVHRVAALHLETLGWERNGQRPLFYWVCCLYCHSNNFVEAVAVVVEAVAVDLVVGVTLEMKKVVTLVVAVALAAHHLAVRLLRTMKKIGINNSSKQQSQYLTISTIILLLYYIYICCNSLLFISFVRWLAHLLSKLLLHHYSPAMPTCKFHMWSLNVCSVQQCVCALLHF